MKNLKPVQLAKKEDINEANLDELVGHLQSTCHTIPPLAFANTRIIIAELLQKSGNPIADSFSRIVFPSGTPHQYRTHEKEVLRNIIDGSDKEGLFIIKEQEKVAAIAGFKLYGKADDGRDVFLLTKRATLPAYEGQGLSKNLDSYRMKWMKEKYPDAVLIAMTRNPIVKKMMKEQDMRMIGFREFFEHHARLEDKPEKWIASAVDHMESRNLGWQCYSKELQG